ACTFVSREVRRKSPRCGGTSVPHRGYTSKEERRGASRCQQRLMSN
ncbi:unnamed protein product, partial [Ectocarpus sp. 8 AP-2014]